MGRDGSEQARKPRNSRFKGHRLYGRRHVPTMLDLPTVPTLRPFRKRAFPDFLWLLTMLRMRPLREGAGPTTRALDLGQAAFRRAHERGAIAGNQVPVFQGLLTQWERIPEQERQEVLEHLRGEGIYDHVAPESLAHTLAAYDASPGRWLIQPRLDAGLEPDVERAEEHLWETFRLGGDSHQELATHAQYLWLGSLAKMRRLRFHHDDSGFKAVARYESGGSEVERKLAETTIRASFLAASAADATDDSTPEAWCERFWHDNRRLFACRWKPGDPPGADADERARDASIRLHLLHYRFLKAADAIDPNLWDHDRYDVLTGITWRILRIGAHLATNPVLWSEEHGYPSIRMLFESFVQLKWMLAVEKGRPQVWHEFKNYGRGRAKALLLHTEAAVERYDGDPKEILEGLVPKLKAQANRDIPEAFQDISDASSFAPDHSLRAMAEAVGLGDMYQSVMIPASSTLHGDWSALEDQVLDRCLHPLHDGHAIPRSDYAPRDLLQFPYLAERFARWSFDEYCRALGHEPITDDDATAEMLAHAGEAWEGNQA